MKGIAYVGALEVLDKEGILKDVERVAGTSAGAMIAVLVGLRYSADEMKEILWNLNFRNFMDNSFGIIRDTTRMLKEKVALVPAIVLQQAIGVANHAPVAIHEIVEVKAFEDLFQFSDAEAQSDEHGHESACRSACHAFDVFEDASLVEHT